MSNHPWRSWRLRGVMGARGGHRELVGNHRELVGNHRELVGNHRELVGNHRELVGVTGSSWGITGNSWGVTESSWWLQRARAGYRELVGVTGSSSRVTGSSWGVTGARGRSWDEAGKRKKEQMIMWNHPEDLQGDCRCSTILSSPYPRAHPWRSPSSLHLNHWIQLSHVRSFRFYILLKIKENIFLTLSIRDFSSKMFSSILNFMKEKRIWLKRIILAKVDWLKKKKTNRLFAWDKRQVCKKELWRFSCRRVDKTDMSQ